VHARWSVFAFAHSVQLLESIRSFPDQSCIRLSFFRYGKIHRRCVGRCKYPPVFERLGKLKITRSLGVVGRLSLRWSAGPFFASTLRHRWRSCP
jgi:hypothetical protein